MRIRQSIGGAALAACLAVLGAVACQPPAGGAAPEAGATPPTTTSSQPATAAGPAAAATGKAPKLEVAEATWDAGTVAAGETIKHVFILRNVGTDVLHIKRAKGS